MDDEADSHFLWIQFCFNSKSIGTIPTFPNPIFLLQKRYNQKYKAEEPFPDHGLPLRLARCCQIARLPVLDYGTASSGRRRLMIRSYIARRRCDMTGDVSPCPRGYPSGEVWLGEC